MSKSDFILCDSHMHVFSRHEVIQSSKYVAPAKDLSDFITEATTKDIGRAVVIQASIDGTDNSRLLDTLLHQDELMLRGVAMIDEHSVGLEELANAGVRALRIQDRSRLGINDLERLPELAAKGAEVDWHVEINTEPARYERLRCLLSKLPEGQSVVLDHFGHCDPSDLEQRNQLCRLLDTGRVWIKLAPTRVSQKVGSYADLTDIVESLAGRYTERCLWGSDWPHVMTSEPLPKTIDMLSFYKNVLTTKQFIACFSGNPATLYRF
ncbi:2-pyrone-4,6-dicarboxylate hydrolase [Marinomonas piezotolerans]|uniref:2-pyrone-4,6-dicarboxylate hydrolase n=1 Tax=Marinomonas piezotolerans TaxID=2213058 RepID=A0A370U9M4_9GAMM|nr:amidohydrolase family protein [Marinomonas piezotolerans]RDL44487.1 2-pyrone-4,6-dicarboxylate hydrolase [Marinomonas piezotolerans]